MVGTLSASQVVFTLRKSQTAKTRGRKSVFDWAFLWIQITPPPTHTPLLSTSLCHPLPLPQPPVQCHCRALSKYALFMFLVAFQYLAAWQRGIKMCVPAKCQWVKRGLSLERHTPWSTCCKASSGGKFHLSLIQNGKGFKRHIHINSSPLPTNTRPPLPQAYFQFRGIQQMEVEHLTLAF